MQHSSPEVSSNPISAWRGGRNIADAAWELCLTPTAYELLENSPWKFRARSDRIIKIADVTGISLEALVDHLEQKGGKNGR
jgi:hypothetical protein